MSRTYRKHLNYFKVYKGEVYSCQDYDDYKKLWNRQDADGLYCSHASGFIKLTKSRDHKPWGKPPKWFKKIQIRYERSKVKQAIRNGKEEVPYFKRTNDWDWT